MSPVSLDTASPRAFHPGMRPDDAARARQLEGLLETLSRDGASLQWPFPYLPDGATVTLRVRPAALPTDAPPLLGLPFVFRFPEEIHPAPIVLDDASSVAAFNLSPGAKPEDVRMAPVIAGLLHPRDIVRDAVLAAAADLLARPWHMPDSRVPGGEIPRYVRMVLSHSAMAVFPETQDAETWARWTPVCLSFRQTHGHVRLAALADPGALWAPLGAAIRSAAPSQ